MLLIVQVRLVRKHFGNEIIWSEDHELLSNEQCQLREGRGQDNLEGITFVRIEIGTIMSWTKKSYSSYSEFDLLEVKFFSKFSSAA